MQIYDLNKCHIYHTCICCLPWIVMWLLSLWHSCFTMGSSYSKAGVIIFTENAGLTCLRSATVSVHHKLKRPVFTRTDQKHWQSARRGPQRNKSGILRDESQLGPFCALSSPLRCGLPSVWKVLVGGNGMSFTAGTQHNLDKTVTCQPQFWSILSLVLWPCPFSEQLP